MRFDRFASCEVIVPRFQTLSVPPFPRPLSPSFSSPAPLSFPRSPLSLPHPSPFSLPPSPPPEIISECQKWDVMIKQLKLAPTAHIFFMYLGFCEKHWSKAL